MPVRDDRLHIRLTDEERTGLHEAAAADGETISTIVRRLIRDWLRDRGQHPARKARRG